MQDEIQALVIQDQRKEKDREAMETDTVAHGKIIAKKDGDSAKKYENLATLHKEMAKSNK